MAKPNEIKKLQGTLKPSRVKDSPMSGSIATIDSIDKDVLLNDYAREEWDRAFVELSEIGLIQTTDINALIMLCNMWGWYCECKDFMSKGDYLIDTPNGMPQNHPHLNNWRIAHRDYLTLCKEFGLTPIARTKIEMPSKPKKDGLGDLL